MIDLISTEIRWSQSRRRTRHRKHERVFVLERFCTKTRQNKCKKITEKTIDPIPTEICCLRNRRWTHHRKHERGFPFGMVLHQKGDKTHLVHSSHFIVVSGTFHSVCVCVCLCLCLVCGDHKHRQCRQTTTRQGNQDKGGGGAIGRSRRHQLQVCLHFCAWQRACYLVGWFWGLVVRGLHRIDVCGFWVGGWHIWLDFGWMQLFHVLFDIVHKRCLALWGLDFWVGHWFGEQFTCSGELNVLCWCKFFFHLDIVCVCVAVCSALWHFGGVDVFCSWRLFRQFLAIVCVQSSGHFWQIDG